MTRYFIGGTFRPAIELEIDGTPPCFLCGVPVTSPSMGGPLICGACDCGKSRHTGQRKTDQEHEESRALWKTMVERYRIERERYSDE